MKAEISFKDLQQGNFLAAFENFFPSSVFTSQYFPDLEICKRECKLISNQTEVRFCKFSLRKFLRCLMYGKLFAYDFLKNPFPHFLNYFHGKKFSRFKCLNEFASPSSHVTKSWFRNVKNCRYIKKSLEVSLIFIKLL